MNNLDLVHMVDVEQRQEDYSNMKVAEQVPYNPIGCKNTHNSSDHSHTHADVPDLSV